MTKEVGEKRRTTPEAAISYLIIIFVKEAVLRREGATGISRKSWGKWGIIICCSGV
jgi:hypothetical protein